MIRKIIKIDEERCSGCGLCAEACHEQAIGMVKGKAKLLRDDYCDGLGNCLPACPAGAISFEEREAAAFKGETVKTKTGGGQAQPPEKPEPALIPARQGRSQLNQWPIQIKLVPVKAPYFDNAQLLIAADCTAYACGSFHEEFMRNKITLIGCPKLDNADYSEKLSAILQNSSIKSLTVIRMEVPCCRGIKAAAAAALKNSGKIIPWRTLVISTGGEVLEDS
ncbi:MAG: 4Fe-4S binding protein [Treponema sp.]|jgi:ferredoxin|nr:4Fe-4S binding protein [Treponema sp.]